MYNNTIKSKLRVNASNIPGWRTPRHIVVIESDDWGSVRMSSLDAYKNLLDAGIPVNKSHYNIYDSLESNEDLEMLFDVLSRHVDSTGRNPVITGVNVVANPNYEKIEDNGYSIYEYEPFTETCKRFQNHDCVRQLYLNGISKRLFVPTFHGREHLNAQRWIKSLQSGNKSVLLAFENHVTGIPKKGIDGELVPNFQAAFDLDNMTDLEYQKQVITTGTSLFYDIFGYKPSFFVPTNGYFNNTLEETLYQCGIEYIDTAKRQEEPLGNGQYRINKRYIGNKNSFGQIYLTRNCFFEPAATGFEVPENYDWLNYCLKEIEIAFRWHKPATISSHRVNYIGYLHPENREKNLKLLSQLLGEIIKRWPDVEFMTSVELGELIEGTMD